MAVLFAPFCLSNVAAVILSNRLYSISKIISKNIIFENCPAFAEHPGQARSPSQPGTSSRQSPALEQAKLLSHQQNKNNSPVRPRVKWSPAIAVAQRTRNHKCFLGNPLAPESHLSHPQGELRGHIKERRTLHPHPYLVCTMQMLGAAGIPSNLGR